MEVITVTKENFEEEVLKSSLPVLIDFNADWCGPCRMIRPMIDDIASNNDNIKIVSINIDDEDELADKYEVSSIPCLVLIKDGKEVNRNVGLIAQDQLESFIGE